MKRNQVIALTIISIIGLAAITIFTVLPQERIYEKRALIFHANVLLNYGFTGITRESFVDINRFNDQLISLGYNTSWFYFDNNNSLAFNFLKILQEESKKSEQLIILIAAHGIYQDGQYYQLLEKPYSSNAIMEALDHQTKTFIYAAGCQSGYFASHYEIPKRWVILSSVFHGIDLGNATINTEDVTDAEIHWPALEAFTAAMLSCTSIEAIYSTHSIYLADYYNGTYFSWDNAPVLWDGDTITDWIL